MIPIPLCPTTQSTNTNTAPQTQTTNNEETGGEDEGEAPSAVMFTPNSPYFLSPPFD